MNYFKSYYILLILFSIPGTYVKPFHNGHLRKIGNYSLEKKRVLQKMRPSIGTRLNDVCLFFVTYFFLKLVRHKQLRWPTQISSQKKVSQPHHPVKVMNLTTHASGVAWVLGPLGIIVMLMTTWKLILETCSSFALWLLKEVHITKNGPKVTSSICSLRTG